MKECKPYAQILKRKTRSAIQKLYELDKEIQGYGMVIVSVKKSGVDDLKASYFIWGSKDGDNPDKELAWDCGEKNYSHDKVVENLIRDEQ